MPGSKVTSPFAKTHLTTVSGSVRKASEGGGVFLDKLGRVFLDKLGSGDCKGPYPPSDLCRIGARIEARIGHQRPILALILAPIPMGMTLLVGTWPTFLGQWATG